MTDERLAELREDRDKAIDKRTELKCKIEDMHAQVRRMSLEVQRLNLASKELAEPYKIATEKVADLTMQINAEEQQRKVEAEAKAAEAKANAKAEAEAEEASQPEQPG